MTIAASKKLNKSRSNRKTNFVFLGRRGVASGDYYQWLTSAYFPIRLASRQLRFCIVRQRRLDRMGQGGNQ